MQAKILIAAVITVLGFFTFKKVLSNGDNELVKAETKSRMEIKQPERWHNVALIPTRVRLHMNGLKMHGLEIIKGINYRKQENLRFVFLK